MSVAVKFNSELGIIESVLADNVTPEDLRMHEARCIALAKETGSSCFLTDATAAAFKVSELDLYDLPQFYDREGIRRPIRIAVLPPATEAVRRLVGFYETVCANRGWTVAAFEERQEALDWLGDGASKD